MKECDLKNIAVIVIDMLNDFVKDDGALVVPSAKNLIPNQQDIIEVARKNDAMIIFLADNHLVDDPEFKMWPPHAVKGTDGAKVIEDLAPHKDDRVIPKRKYSGFDGTDLDATLRENKIENVILVGVLTDICVMYTSADASSKGYDVYVVNDATSSSSNDNHEFALKHIESVHGSTIVSTDDVIRILNQ